MKKTILVSLIVFSITSCTKLAFEDNLFSLAQKEENQFHSLVNMLNINSSMDWEFLDFMPTPPGATAILAPWSLGANTSFPPSFINDRFKIDGWELLYNTFSDSIDINPKFFMLYNRYTGFARAFFYLGPITPIPSTYITHTLEMLNVPAIPLLNYASSEIISLKTNVKEVSQVLPYQTAATGSWYAAEFEMNYIPNINTISASNALMKWNLHSIHVDTISMWGYPATSVQGNLAQASAGDNLLHKIFKGAVQATGSATSNEIKQIFDHYEIKNPFITSFLTTLVTGGISIASDKVLNVIFGSKSGNSNTQVNLKATANYTFRSTNTNSYLLASPTIIPPGVSNINQQTGILPIYNKKLGLVTLSKHPDVTAIHEQHWFVIFNEAAGIPDEQDYIFNPSSYLLQPNSYQIIFNPDIINNSADGAQIENLEQKLVRRYGDTTAITIHPLTHNFFDEYRVDIGFVGYYRDNNRLIYVPAPVPWPWDEEYLLRTYHLRIKFDVVPNNGAPRTTVVKTFKMNPVVQYQ